MPSHTPAERRRRRPAKARVPAARTARRVPATNRGIATAVSPRKRIR